MHLKCKVVNLAFQKKYQSRTEPMYVGEKCHERARL